MTLNPLHDIRAIDEVLERMFAPSQPQPAPASRAYSLPIDVVERDNAIIVRAAVPGIEPSDLEVTFENHILTIQGEVKAEEVAEGTKVYRRENTYGKFVRSIRLPRNLNEEAITADFKNGIVTVTLPRVEVEKPKALKIEIKTAE
ncbi:MAG: Hsp20/alpha crystallin family protein [Fimbriimonas sp.]